MTPALIGEREGKCMRLQGCGTVDEGRQGGPRGREGGGREKRGTATCPGIREQHKMFAFWNLMNQIDLCTFSTHAESHQALVSSSANRQ